MNRLPRIILIITSVLVLILGFVMAGCSSESTPTSGAELSTYQLEINLLGQKNEFLVDSHGMLKSKIEVSSADGKLSLFMNKDTTVLDKDGKPLHIIQAVVNPSPSNPPEDAYIVSSVYSLKPQGATFDPQILLSLNYDPGKLVEGSRERDLYVAYHNGTEWCTPSYKKVDTKIHSVTTQLSNFNSTVFAILGPKQVVPPTPSIGTQGTNVGNLAPDFQLHNLKKELVSLGDFRGKPVLLNFWATWCHPCVSEMPFLQEVNEEWSAKELQVLAVNMSGTSSQVAEFLQSHDLSLPVLLDTKKDIASSYNIQYIPTTFFIDKDGIIQVVKVGAFANKEAIENDLSKIIS